MAKLDNKIVLISGGTTGIGAETARLFRSEGATVIVTGSSERSVEAARASLPGIEVLVSNAGDVARPRLWSTRSRPRTAASTSCSSTPASPVRADRRGRRGLLRQSVQHQRQGRLLPDQARIPVIPNGGTIILTASVAGANGGLGGSTIYGSTKAALRSFGRTIAKELTPRGIRVNTISPGPIVTPILDKGLTAAQKDNFIEGAKTRIPLGRTGTVAEVAAAALYLAADATYTTGAELFVDGGLIDL